MRRFALPCLALSFAAALHAAEDEHSWTPLRDGADKAIQAAAAFETAQRKQTTSPRIQLIPHGLVTISIDERLQALRASQDAENGIPLEEESSIGSVDPAVLMRNVEAALDAVASPSLIPEENAPSAGEAADAAGRAAAELIAAPVKDPLDDALLAPPPEPLDYVFLEAKLCFDQGRLDDLEEMLPLFEHHELSGYPALWALILKLKKFPDDPVVDQDFRRFIDLHEGEYLAENARTQYLKLRGEKLNAADFDLFFKGLVWNQTDPVIEAWQAYYTLESAQAENNQSKIAAALLKAKVLYRDSKAVTDPALMKLGDRIAEADRTWLWTRVMILLQKNRMTETKRVLETLPRPELPAPMKSSVPSLTNLLYGCVVKKILEIFLHASRSLRLYALPISARQMPPALHKPQLIPRPMPSGVRSFGPALASQPLPSSTPRRAAGTPKPAVRCSNLL